MRKGLHSWYSACVSVDIAGLYKILRLVPSQRPVSKHAAAVLFVSEATISKSPGLKTLIQLGQEKDFKSIYSFIVLRLFYDKNTVINR